MIRSMLFFRLKPVASEAHMVELTQKFGDYRISKGCLQRRTMKLLDPKRPDEDLDTEP